MPTIEDFFIKEYERVVAENNELKAAQRKIDVESPYGITDLHEPVEMVLISIEDSTYFWEKTKLTQKQLNSLLELSDDEFFEKMKEVKRPDWTSGRALKVSQERYRYSILISDLDGSHRYAIDNTKPVQLIPLDIRLDENSRDYGAYYELRHYEQLKKQAISDLREAIRNRIEAIEKEEAGE